MKRVWAVVFALLAWLLLSGSTPAADAAQASAVYAPVPQALFQAEDCPQRVAEFHGGDTRLDQFLHPVLETDAQRKERLAEAEIISRCLAGDTQMLSSEDRTTKWAVNTFLLFVGDEDFAGRSVSNRQMHKFSDLDDPAILQLRDSAHLPDPDQGDLYIWFFPSKEAMPPEIRAAFPTDQVKGVTIGTHFIAVLTEGPAGETSDHRAERVGKILSHELVHAYINSSLAQGAPGRLPTWYSEGLAIHFSGSSEPSSIVGFGPNGQEVHYISFPPQDYAQYRDNFNYLETRYGRGRFMELVHQSVVEANPQVLLSPLGIADEKELVYQARAARIGQSLQRLGLLAGGLLLVILILWGRRLSGALYRGLLRLLYPIPNVAALSRRRDTLALIRCLAYQNAHFPARAAQVRLEAVHALGRTADERAVPALLQLLQNNQDDRDVFEHLAAIQALGSFKHEAVVDALIGQLDHSSGVAVRAADALQQIGSPRAVLPVIQCAVRTEGPEYHELIHTLARWHQAHDLLPTLAELLKHPDAQVRQEVVSVLGKVPGEPPQRLLLSALADSDARVRRVAIQAAAEQGGEIAAAALREDYHQMKTVAQRLELLDALALVRSDLALRLAAEILQAGDSPLVTFRAAVCVGQVGGPRALPILRPYLDSTLAIPWGRRYLMDGYRPIFLHLPSQVVHALGQTEDEAAIPEILRALRSRHEDVRKSAAFTLEYIYNHWMISEEQRGCIRSEWLRLVTEVMSVSLE